jgi:predicted DNA-binding transcriptional regulator AlpA
MRTGAVLTIEQATRLWRPQEPLTEDRLRALLREELAKVSTGGEPDRLVDIEEMSRLSTLSIDFLYHNRKRLPFAVKIGNKLVKWSVKKFSLWDGKLLPAKPRRA